MLLQKLISPSKLPLASFLPTLPLQQSLQSVPPAASLPSPLTGSLLPQPHTARSELLAGKWWGVCLILPCEGGKIKNTSQRSPPDVEQDTEGEEKIEEEDGENGEEDDNDENNELDLDNDTTMRNAASSSQPTAVSALHFFIFVFSKCFLKAPWSWPWWQWQLWKRSFEKMEEFLTDNL